MMSMIFSDFFTFSLPGYLNDMMTGNTPIKITQEMMLALAVIQEIPIVMIFLSRMLNYRANRLVNIIAGVITIVYIIALGSPYLHYYFFAAVQVTAILLIMRYSWKLNNCADQSVDR
jgi:Sec-independent protein secretion pathway component TatC